MSKVGDARVWLQAHGREVGARGRIRPELLQEYEDYLRSRTGDPGDARGQSKLQPVDPKLASSMAPTGKSRGRTSCGFCSDGVHHMCPGTIARAAGGKDWTCLCYEDGHDHPPVRLIRDASRDRKFDDEDG